MGGELRWKGLCDMYWKLPLIKRYDINNIMNLDNGDAFLNCHVSKAFDHDVKHPVSKELEALIRLYYAKEVVE